MGRGSESDEGDELWYIYSNGNRYQDVQYAMRWYNIKGSEGSA